MHVFTKYFSEIVYGGSDGIVTTFAVVAGFSGAQIFSSDALLLTFSTVLLFGFANLSADGLSMGLGNYLSIRAQNDLYRRKYAELSMKSNSELVSLVDSLDFDEEQSELIKKLIPSSRKLSIDLLLNKQDGVEPDESQNPKMTGLATFLSFILFGSIPLVPYLFLDTNPLTAFAVTIVFTLFALTLLGILRWRISRVNLGMSMVETVGLGSIAAAAAFIVGTLFAL